jgi:hypothetical protein
VSINGSGLTITAGNAHYSRVVLLSPRRAESTERRFRVVDNNLCCLVVDMTRDDRGGCAVLPGDADVIAAVKIRALQCKEQLAFADCACVRADAFKGSIRALQFAPH